jgi:hypothetical protein
MTVGVHGDAVNVGLVKTMLLQLARTAGRVFKAPGHPGRRELLLRLLLDSFAVPETRPASIFINELDAGSLKRVAHR